MQESLSRDIRVSFVLLVCFWVKEISKERGVLQKVKVIRSFLLRRYKVIYDV